MSTTMTPVALDDAATLGDLREAVTTLEDAERIARRVLGGAHPTTTGIERDLQRSREALAARETPPSNAQNYKILHQKH